MEKLGDPRHLHMAHDWPLLLDHLCWPSCPHIYSKLVLLLFYFFYFTQHKKKLIK